jgi:hypothetical protein
MKIRVFRGTTSRCRCISPRVEGRHCLDVERTTTIKNVRTHNSSNVIPQKTRASNSNAVKNSRLSTVTTFITPIQIDFLGQPRSLLKLMFRLTNQADPRISRVSAAARYLRLWVRTPPCAWISVSCESYELQVSTTSWSLVKRSPTAYDVSLCMI